MVEPSAIRAQVPHSSLYSPVIIKTIVLMTMVIVRTMVVIAMTKVIVMVTIILVTWCLTTCEDGRHPNCLVLKRLEERHFIKNLSPSFITKINR